MLLPLAIASCGGDDKDEPTANTSADPDGTIPISVNVGDNVKCLDTYVGIDKSYNLYCGYNGGNTTLGNIHVVGPVKGIGNINYLESAQLTLSAKAAVMVGYGYIIKQYSVHGDGEWAVYVDSEITSTNGGVLGYFMKVRKLERKVE